MQPVLIEEVVDLRDHPEPSKMVEAVSSVTIGDLHGNALKLLYFLIREGVLSLADPNQYAEFVEIYCKSIDEITIQDIKAMRSIVKKSSVNNTIKVCLIGDEFADRGSNDYFTLLLLKRLHEARVKLEINISNHGLEFIYAYESGDFLNRKSFEIMPFQSGSIYALRNLIERFPDLSLLDDVSAFVDNIYKSTLRLISYDADLQNKSIFIRTHAPCDLHLIKDAVNYFNNDYNDNSLHDLMNSIDSIQLKISEYIAESCVSILLGRDPLRLFLWNRNTELTLDPSMLTDISRQERLYDYSIHYIHGHTPGITNHYVSNLDTMLGKCHGSSSSFQSSPQITEFNHVGAYKVLRLIEEPV
ncbi:MAG: hypothetical protein K2X50_01135 [Gammaproteobacteria bacterium]|nr:hypothetical protein [Gammaproteobacteria bacterium]